MKLDIDSIRALAELLDETNLSEIEVTEGENSIRVNRGMTSVNVSNPAPIAAMAQSPVQESAAAPASGGVQSDHPGTVKSPMVGTVYLQPEPGTDSFVRPGDSVKEGDTLVIIEAMKVMNPIKSPKAGVVKEILVTDSQPVEFDEPLVIVE